MGASSNETEVILGKQIKAIVHCHFLPGFEHHSNIHVADVGNLWVIYGFQMDGKWAIIDFNVIPYPWQANVYISRYFENPSCWQAIS